jgi:hypothetical protein
MRVKVPPHQGCSRFARAMGQDRRTDYFYERALNAIARACLKLWYPRWLSNTKCATAR